MRTVTPHQEERILRWERAIVRSVYGTDTGCELSGLPEPLEIAIRASQLLWSVGASVSWADEPPTVEQIQVAGRGGYQWWGHEDSTERWPSWAPLRAFDGFLPPEQVNASTGAPSIVAPFAGARLVVRWPNGKGAHGFKGGEFCQWLCWSFSLWRFNLEPAGWTIDRLRDVTGPPSECAWMPPSYLSDEAARSALFDDIPSQKRATFGRRAALRWSVRMRKTLDLALLDELALDGGEPYPVSYTHLTLPTID
jgi:hypothetical protein